jgi:hypothetical protein
MRVQKNEILDFPSPRVAVPLCGHPWSEAPSVKSAALYTACTVQVTCRQALCSSCSLHATRHVQRLLDTQLPAAPALSITLQQRKPTVTALVAHRSSQSPSL